MDPLQNIHLLSQFWEIPGNAALMLLANSAVQKTGSAAQRKYEDWPLTVFQKRYIVNLWHPSPRNPRSYNFIESAPKIYHFNLRAKKIYHFNLSVRFQSSGNPALGDRAAPIVREAPRRTPDGRPCKLDTRTKSWRAPRVQRCSKSCALHVELVSNTLRSS